MKVAQNVRDVYADFEPRDTYYFKVGSHGLISFQSKNCRLKQRMSHEQKKQLLRDQTFLQISTNFYVNVSHICAVEQQYVYFGDKKTEESRVPISSRIEQLIKTRLTQV